MIYPNMKDESIYIKSFGICIPSIIACLMLVCLDILSQADNLENAKKNTSSNFWIFVQFFFVFLSLALLLSTYARLVMPLIECSTQCHVESQEREGERKKDDHWYAIGRWNVAHYIYVHRNIEGKIDTLARISFRCLYYRRGNGRWKLMRNDFDIELFNIFNSNPSNHADDSILLHISSCSNHLYE